MKTTSHSSFSLADVVAARRRIAGGLRLTPCALAPAFARELGISIWLKREDLQRTGSFKERGARHALWCLTEAEKARGVVAASAGNHALGLAFHGQQLGVRVTVVMPAGASAVKVTRCRQLGADVVLHGANFDAAQTHAVARAAAGGAVLVPPFDDERVIAGQGTLALEMMEQVQAFDTVVVPVGGGGLLAGVATAIKALRPDVKVVAVEPERAAGFSAAWRAGAPVRIATAPTLADGLAVARVGEVAFAVARSRVDDVVTVSEQELANAIGWLARSAGVVAEGAGAAALAAVMAGKVRTRVVIVPVTGRNVDPRAHARAVAAGGACEGIAAANQARATRRLMIS
ncbi:threonine/serine dehydratase [Horticoccus luteus]|uniref:Threonine/serine dehydratase n=1 Tax=Horticoccus luteus TaxID=2862869 RepID=A0A8F9TU69_9BACT|nr:threonine/serine dehydratase [Horticoccus luteus]QYM79141.1 threonine/serine dehydratase [Horticoccus luteus]